MKIKLNFIVLVLFALTTSAFAAKWTIDSFDDSSDPGEADSFITGEASEELEPVSPDQISSGNNVLYIRQKFEDPMGEEEATYQFFKGEPTEEAKNLGKISIDGIPYPTLLKMKLFYSKSASGDDDLGAVYFDGTDIFIEGEDPVYMNLNGRMEEFKPIVSREFKISINSTPEDATVSVANSEKGTTPLTFNVSSAKPVTVVVSKEGYFPTVKPVVPNDKKTVEENFSLTEKEPIVNPADDLRERLQTAAANQDATAIKTVKADIQKAINNHNSNSKKTLDAAMKKFPANPSKISAESSSDFSSRQNIWNTFQTRERNSIVEETKTHLTDLKNLLEEADSGIFSVAAAPVPAEEEEEYEDDEYAYDEEADEEEFEDGMATQEEQDYSKYDASGSATDIFGNTDEYLFWTGIAFAAVAAGTLTVGIMENMKWSDAKTAYDAVVTKDKEVRKQIEAACNQDQACIANAINVSSTQGSVDEIGNPIDVLYQLNTIKNTNKKTMDSYNTSRIIWFSAGALSAAVSITLLTW